MAARYLALLRGINVGGKNKLPMRALTALCKEAGCRDIASYIQSGNVVFDVDHIDGLAARLAQLIEQQYGLQVPVVVREVSELQAVVRDNPFLLEGAAPDSLHLAFLAGEPTAAAITKLDPDRSPPDRFRVVGRHIYLHCPAGFGNTKLTNAYFDSKLATISTVRNWRTVTTLLGMLAA